MLPALDYSLSTEHKWASGSITLSVELFSSLLHTIVRELAETQPARNLIIVNGHGGNRGVLETLILEFRARYEIVSVILHPSALSSVKSNSNLFEVHGGKSETSLIMAFTPMFVRNDKIPDAFEKEVQNNVKQLVLDRAVSWPWNSNDLGLGVNGIIGDPANATIELGNAIIDSAVDNAEEAIKHLVLFGKAIRSNKGGNLNGSE
jgi:creatinine amidohydrolase/Fe(II)-dependent formamide hydrolase-like protein